MTDLYLSVDVGGSGSKVIFQLASSDEPEYLMFSPEVEPINRASLDNYFTYQGWVGSPAPEQQVWLEVNQKCFVLGPFAQCFDPEDRIFELKYENALYKVLAIIGLIRQKHSLNTRKKLKVQLALLLPWDEYSDRQRFRERLETMLKEYTFRGEKQKVILEKFVCYPEGGGLALTRIKLQGTDWLRDKRLGVLMFGHRNVTALYFEQGALKKGDSPRLGFVQFLDTVVEMKSGLDRDSLAKAIFEGMSSSQTDIYVTRNVFEYGLGQTKKALTQHPDWAELDSIKALATAKDPLLRSGEVADLVSGIEVATASYWEKLEKWLNKVLPRQLDEVVISGGAAHYLEPELEDYFNCQPSLEREPMGGRWTGEYKRRDWENHFTPIVWGAGIQKQVERLFDITRKDSELALGFRLIDVFGLFDFLVELSEENETNA